MAIASLVNAVVQPPDVLRATHANALNVMWSLSLIDTLKDHSCATITKLLTNRRAVGWMDSSSSKCQFHVRHHPPNGGWEELT